MAGATLISADRGRFQIRLRYRLPGLIGVGVTAAGVLIIATLDILSARPLIDALGAAGAAILVLTGIPILAFIWCGHMIWAQSRTVWLELSPSGVRYSSPRAAITAAWDDIVGIGPVMPPDTGLGSPAEFDGLQVATPVALKESGIFVVDRAIIGSLPPLAGVPMAPFEANWRRGEIGRMVQEFAPHLRVLDTPGPDLSEVGIRRPPGGLPAVRRLSKMFLVLPLLYPFLAAMGTSISSYGFLALLLPALGLGCLAALALLGAELLPRDRVTSAAWLRALGMLSFPVGYASLLRPLIALILP